MKIAIVNKYLRPKGGADVCALAQARLLKDHGHEVVLMGMPPAEGEALNHPVYEVTPVDYQADMGIAERCRAALGLIYSRTARRRLDELIRRESPDLIHFHNVYHQLSPSVIDAAAERRVPCVMTLHDYKVTCPVYTHYRDGNVCEQCRGRRFTNCLRFRCNNGSVIQSALNAVETWLHHRHLNIYGGVDLYISPSRFLREKVHELGFSGRIAHLSNFVDLRDFTARYGWDRRRIAYFGRLSEEKGLLTLLRAVRGLSVELLLIGTGPVEDALRARAREWSMENVRFAGYRTGEDLRGLVGGSMLTVLPSEWYENNPRSVMESFALGTPVIGARIGGIPELVGGSRGACFEPGEVGDLRAAISRLVCSPNTLREMGKAARAFAEKRCGRDVHYSSLMDIYGECMR